MKQDNESSYGEQKLQVVAPEVKWVEARGVAQVFSPVVYRL